MLARTVLSHEQLGITERERDLLLKVLNRLEANPPPHIKQDNAYSCMWFDGDEPDGFNMTNIFSRASCGTAACLLGWALAFGGTKGQFALFGTGWDNNRTAACQRLFCPTDVPKSQWDAITVEQGAQALRNYLATGEANWADVLKESAT